MKQINLYIAAERVDMATDSIIALTYALEDTSNPTIVKNMFSKSIDLPGTPRNNRIFGHFYELTRRVSLSADIDSGVGFNPLKRVPFSLYVEAELIEQGYMQLNRVTMHGRMPWYTVTLYGGLGDFFYNLHYDSNGDKRTLATLDFGITGATSADTEMDFTITKERVAASWSVVGGGRNTLAEVITHVPAYNGVPRDFDSEHAMVNMETNEIGLPTTASDNGTQYSTYQGYALAEFKSPLDEWEVRDLRSYLQRPALSVRSLIQAMCNPRNNGGYTVNLDSTFFNEDNPLYHDAYITLPMLNAEGDREDVRTPIASTSTDFIGGDGNIYEHSVRLADVLPIDSYQTATAVKVTVPLSLRVVADIDAGSLYTDVTRYEVKDKEVGGGIYVPTIEPVSTMYSAIVAKLLIIDMDSGDILTASPYMALSNEGAFAQDWAVFAPGDDIDRGVINIVGQFNRVSDTDSFIFEDAEGSNTFPLEATFIKGDTSNIRVAVNVQRAYKVADNVWSSYPGKLAAIQSYIGDMSADVPVSGLSIGIITDNSGVVFTTSPLPGISSGSKITKAMLLSGDATPADYLLSYAKLFGLRFMKDVATKTITITSRYFTGEILDIDRRVNRGADIVITPNVFDTKFLRLALDMPDTQLAKRYRADYGLDYAQKRVDTNYGFNNETKDIYDGNVFKAAIPCLATSRLFYNFRTSEGVSVYPPIAQGLTLSLFNGSSADGIASYGLDIPSREYIDTTKTIAIGPEPGHDNVAKMCYFDMSDDQRDPVDMANNLVIYCGHVPLTDNQGTAISYYLTDDIPAMITLNGQPCYILTDSVYDNNNDNIAIPVARLPQFLSVRLINGRVWQSFDFAVPKELYIGNVDYSEAVTLYDRYWADLYSDRVDADTRRVSAEVDLNGLVVSAEMLRKFYYFDGAYWLLIKIEDYNPAGSGLTRCEFIKVKNTRNYYRGEFNNDTSINQEE